MEKKGITRKKGTRESSQQNNKESLGIQKEQGRTGKKTEKMVKKGQIIGSGGHFPFLFGYIYTYIYIFIYFSGEAEIFNFPYLYFSRSGQRGLEPCVEY